MIKTIFVLIMAFQSFASASQQINCNFTSGGVYNVTTGEKVSTTFNPRIFKSLTNLDLDKTEQDIYMSSFQNSNFNLMGYICKNEQRQGYDCFRLSDNSLKREVKAYTSNENQKLLQLVMPTGAPGNFVQQDTYTCNR